MLSHGMKLEGIVIGIPGRYSHFCTISWNCNCIPNVIDIKYLWTEVMKYNKNMKEMLIQARIELDHLYPDVKQKRNNKKLVGITITMVATKK